MPAIEVENLTKTYGGVNVVDGISFHVDEGEIFGIVGPNGAGKTTTVESVAGLRRPDSGSISVLGMDPQRDRLELTQRLGVQLQESALQDRIRVAEVLDLYASFYDHPADWRELLGRLGLEEKENANYSSLSGGQKQRLAVALALVGSPEIAILDELTTGLDPQARRSVWGTIEQIRDNGVTVVLVTHFMEEAERLCDRVMVVAQGQVTAIDTPAGLVERMGGACRIRFRPSVHVEDEALTSLSDVDSLVRSGDQIEIVGGGDVVHAVTSLLAQRQIIAHDLRIEQDNLEDAYLSLTKETN
ncbi:MAG: ABC transporter ATP-binding protein [bacterium]|nr:ABC transporter ATP-binding protein [bacterium]